MVEPTNPSTGHDDAEGHASRREPRDGERTEDVGTEGDGLRREPQEGEVGDAQGHAFIPPEERPFGGDTPNSDRSDDDDTEGHKVRWN